MNRIAAAIVAVLAIVTVTPFVQALEPDVFEYNSPIVSVSVGKITLTMYLQNNGGFIPGDGWVFEMQPRSSGLLSWVSGQRTCDTTYPQNVHREVIINGGGERVGVTLTSTVPAGTYDIYLLTIDDCCTTNPNCQAKSPYGWGTYVKTVTVSGAQPVCGNGICEGTENPGTCPQDCPGYCGDGYCTLSEQGWCADCPLGCTNPTGNIGEWEADLGGYGYWCTGGDVYGYQCRNGGSPTWTSTKKQDCPYGCENGACIGQACSGTDTSCGVYPNCVNCNAQDGYAGSNFCYDNDVYRKHRDYYCSGTSCTYTESDAKVQECGAEGCNPATGACTSAPVVDVVIISFVIVAALVISAVGLLLWKVF